MPRHVDLRHEGDEALLGVVDEIHPVLSRVVPALAPTDVLAGTDLSQARSARYLDATALIIGQMEVQTVHLVHGQMVDVALRVGGCEEVACDIEHGASPLETRRVDDAADRHREGI